MKKLVCPACGTENSLRSVYSATSSSGLDALAMKCRDCGVKSPLLKTTVDHLVLFAVFGLLALVFHSGILELFPGSHFALVGVEFVIRFIPAMLLAMACMPIAWAVLGPAASADQAGAGLKIVRMTLGVGTALAVILMGLAGQFMAGVLDQPPSDPTTAITTPLDAQSLAWSVRTLTGEDIVLGDLEDEVVFLNIWATWCKPCIAELPSITALAEAAEDVRFLLVSNEDPEVVAKFVEQRDFDLPFVTAESRPELFTTRGIPATFVLHRGQILFRHTGSADWNDAAFRDWLIALD